MDFQDLNLSYITGPTGEKKSVILSMEAFEDLLEQLEDLTVIASRVNEPTVSHEEVLKELREDGLL